MAAVWWRWLLGLYVLCVWLHVRVPERLVQPMPAAADDVTDDNNARGNIDNKVSPGCHFNHSGQGQVQVVWHQPVLRRVRQGRVSWALGQALYLPLDVVDSGMLLRNGMDRDKDTMRCENWVLTGRIDAHQ
jgi:hypothetical protein